jgi:hypothetical protein
MERLRRGNGKTEKWQSNDDKNSNNNNNNKYDERK